MDIIDHLLEIKRENKISKLYEIYNSFFKPPVSVIPIKVRKGEKIIRARINDKKWNHFNSVDDLFCPPSNKTKTQRANIDEFPMFYGAKFIADSEAPIPIAIVLYETSEFARNNNTKGIQRITYSVWEVIEDLTLILIPFGENYDKLNNTLVELEVEWRKLITSIEFEEDKLKLCDFLSAEFSRDNSDYFFTSYFSHFACNILKREHDGIAFPTVKLEGDGLNVAITPESAKKKLQLIGASECYLIKRKMEAFVINAFNALFTITGKTKYIKRKDYSANSKLIENLMSGLKFIN